MDERAKRKRKKVIFLLHNVKVRNVRFRLKMVKKEQILM